MSERRTVAVMFGGRSLEHDVSVVSGLQILHAIDQGLDIHKFAGKGTGHGLFLRLCAMAAGV